MVPKDLLFLKPCTEATHKHVICVQKCFPNLAASSTCLCACSLICYPVTRVNICSIASMPGRLFATSYFILYIRINSMTIRIFVEIQQDVLTACVKFLGFHIGFGEFQERCVLLFQRFDLWRVREERLEDSLLFGDTC